MRGIGALNGIAASTCTLIGSSRSYKTQSQCRYNEKGAVQALHRLAFPWGQGIYVDAKSNQGGYKFSYVHTWCICTTIKGCRMIQWFNWTVSGLPDQNVNHLLFWQLTVKFMTIESVNEISCPNYLLVYCHYCHLATCGLTPYSSQAVFLIKLMVKDSAQVDFHLKV